jgi:hypothetical protein
MRMRIVICTGLTAALSFAAGAVPLASAASSRAALPPGLPGDGTIEIFVTTGTGARGTIVIAGAIGDYGKVLTVGANGKANPNGHFVDVTLRKGTFKVNKTALDKASNSAPPSVMSAATCSFGGSATGSITLSGGTGAYTGITGTIKMTLTFGGDLPFYTSGKNKGKCNMSDSAQPVAQFGSAIGRGTIRFIRTG